MPICRISSSFVRSMVFTLCRALTFSSLPLPANMQVSQTTQPGTRTQGPPSPNLPNLDTVRNAVQPQISKLEPVRAKRCRHWDEKCKDLKEKKASLFFAPENSPRPMIASAKPQPIDWLNQASPFTSPLDLFNASNRPVIDLLIGHRINTARGGKRVTPARASPAL